MEYEREKTVKKAVILAGGLGTRFLPATLALAKELFPICEQPILLYHLEDLAKAGITDVLIICNKLKEKSFDSFINPPKVYISKIEADGKSDYLSNYNKIIKSFNSIKLINQEIGSQFFNDKNGLDYEQRGSSIAILSCMDWVKNEPFVVVNGDDFCIYNDGKSMTEEIIDLYKKVGENVICGREMDKDVIYKYSSMVFGKKLDCEKCFEVKDIIEKPEKGTEPSNVMGFGKYIFTPEVFDKILKSTPRANGEYCITDVVSTLAKSGKVSSCIFDGIYYDCGSKLGLQMAGNYILLRDEKFSNLLIDEFEKLKNILKK